MTSATPDVDVLVVGGGVIGLAIARSLLRRKREVLLIERNGRLGAETTSRNSEVIHAGLYYPTGSLRARLCVSGKELLYRFAEENGVAARSIGKLVVATSEDEIPRIDAIALTAKRNGVADLVALKAAEARALEPEISCVAAYFSPSTGIIDSHGLVQALEGQVANGGGMILLRAAATKIGKTAAGFEVSVESGATTSTISCRSVIVAAGHGSEPLMASLHFAEGYRPPQTFAAKGHYYSLAGQPPFSHLVYPVARDAWLGIHFTLDMAGRSKFGPDLEWQLNVSYDFDDSERRRQFFEREIRRFWPGLPAGALSPDYTGVRPKIYRQGEPAADFAIHGRDRHGVAGLIALFGIESPGLTSSLAMADMVADMLMSDEQ